MLNAFPKHWQGVSLLELLLVLMVVAVGMTLGFQQYVQYARNRDITHIQQSVNQLLQAGSAYYYATCNSGINTGQVSLQTLQAMGVLPNVNAVYNPWGNQPFEVLIISSDASEAGGTPPYLIQVRAEFSQRKVEEVGGVANLLGADKWAGGKTLTWTRLPSQILKNQPIGIRSPGGWVPAVNMTYDGGQPISSNLEVMDSDLAQFSKDEAGKAGGITCPD